MSTLRISVLREGWNAPTKIGGSFLKIAPGVSCLYDQALLVVTNAITQRSLGVLATYAANARIVAQRVLHRQRRRVPEARDHETTTLHHRLLV